MQPKRFYKSHFPVLLFIFFSLINFNLFDFAEEESEIPFPIPMILIDDNGASTASIPLKLISGTAGFNPSLTLNYNSLGGDGILGEGWDLSGLGYIKRNANYGLGLAGSDHYYSGSDGKLIQSSISSDYFRPEKDNFTKYIPIRTSLCGDEACSWMSISPSGLKMYYGEPNGGSDSYNAQIKNSAGYVLTWGLNRIVDPNGNEIKIYYSSDSLTDGTFYPESIVYANGNASVKFEYANRDDWFTSYFGFQNQNTKKVLKRIYTNLQNSEVDRWNFSYSKSFHDKAILTEIDKDGYLPLEFKYAKDDLSPSNSNANKVAEMPNLQISGKYKYSDSTGCNLLFWACLSTAFDLTVELALRQIVCFQCINPFYNDCTDGVTKNISFYTDVNGDGLLDFVRFVESGFAGSDSPVTANRTGRLRVLLGRKDANGFVDFTGSEFRSSDIFRATEGLKILSGDVNGDGKSDFIILEDYDNSNFIKLGLTSSNGTDINIKDSNIKILQKAPNIKDRLTFLHPDQSNYIYLRDINLDGRADLIQWDSDQKQMVVNYSVGDNFSQTPTILSIDASDFGFSNQNFIDIDGNMIPDFVSIDNLDQPDRKLKYILFNDSLGIIRKGSITLGNEGKFDNFYFADINGDKLQDLVTATSATIGGTELKVYLFDGKNFKYHSDQTLNGFYVNQDIKNLSGTIVRDPYVLDIRQDSQTDDIIAYDSDAKTFNFYIHDDNSSYFPTVQIGLTCKTSACGNNVVNGVIYATTDIVSQDINGDSIPETFQLFFVFRNAQNPDVTLQVNYSYHDSANIPIDIQRAQDQGGDTNSGTKWTQITDELYNSWLNGRHFGDYDGDGRDDAIWFDGNSIRIALSKADGNGNLYWRADGNFSMPAKSLTTIADLNSDGMVEAISVFANKKQIRSDVAAPLGTTSQNSDSPYDSTGSITTYSRNYSSPLGLLSEISNSSDNKTVVLYQWEANHNSAKSPSTPSYPIISSYTAKPLAINVKTISFDGNIVETSVGYFNHQYYLDGREKSRDLLYSKIESINSINQAGSTKSVRNFIQGISFELDGLVSAEANYINGSLLQTKSKNYVTISTLLGSTVARLKQETTKNYFNGNEFLNATQNYSFDTYGNVVVESYISPDYTVETVSEKENDTSNWIIGRTTRTKKSVNSQLALDRSYIYSGRNLIQLIDFNDLPEKSFITYDYYPNGNIQSTKDALGNSAISEYDPVLNSFIVKKTNAIGHSILYSYDLGKGLLLSSTNPNGTSDKYSYDDYGRQLEITFAGSSDWNKRFVYSRSGRMGESVAMLLQEDDGNVLRNEDFFDGLHRKIRSAKTLADGYIYTEDTKYRLDGKVEGITLPYLPAVMDVKSTIYSYNGPDGREDSATNPDGTITRKTYENIGDGKIRTTISLESNSGSILSTNISDSDSSNRLLQRDLNGAKTKYLYDNLGRMYSILDPTNQATIITYDVYGRRTSVYDNYSGKTEFKYDSIGNITSVTNSNGEVIQKSYDAIGRLIAVQSNDSKTIDFEYDNGENAIGKLSTISTNDLQTKFEYDPAGNRSQAIVRVDDLEFVSKFEYGISKKLNKITYPDGSIVRYKYSSGGYLNNVFLDIPDKDSFNYPIVNYSGIEIVGDSEMYFNKALGNGLTTKIGFDPYKMRVTGYNTKDSLGQIKESYKIQYDDLGNISDINDDLKPNQSQHFTYDIAQRLVSSTQNSLSTTYDYDASGNILKNGKYTLKYQDSSRKNAVTAATSAQESFTYSYDNTGKMTNRNGDVFLYDTFGNLTKTSLENGENYEFLYDYSGSRVKKARVSNNATLYSVFELYDLERTPGNPEKHTLYIKGAQGEIVAQITREDATLISAYSIPPTIFISITKAPIVLAIKSLLGQISSSKVAMMVSQLDFVRSIILLIAISMISLAGSRAIRIKRSEGNWASYFAPSILSVFLIANFQSCGLLPTNSGSGEAPWALFPLLINPDTPSINSPTVPAVPPGGGFSNSAQQGVVFLLSDHLGSIRHFTDGNGNFLSGGDQPGVSEINYKPYGEIDRTNSYGPNISKLKYSQQQEDIELGLYYFKTRYYDPAIGRFVQPDDFIFGGSLFGQNRYMFVDGNPIKYRDPTGQSSITHKWNETLHAIFGNHEDVRKAIEASIREALTDSDDPVVKFLSELAYSQIEERKIKSAMQKQLLKTGVTAVAGIALIWFMPASMPVEWAAVTTALGAGSLGYAIGSTTGYLLAGGSTSYSRGINNPRTDQALEAAEIFGTIGSAIGSSTNGMDELYNATDEQFLEKIQGFTQDFAGTVAVGGFTRFRINGKWDLSYYNLKESYRRQSDPAKIGLSFIMSFAFKNVGEPLAKATGFKPLEEIDDTGYGLAKGIILEYGKPAATWVYENWQNPWNLVPGAL
ncbi:hypothetical protein CH371_18635 [Leptospira wolffii]|uniref:Teneurin-like YD-shell domain-containing protein n=1 Tax=Leptospira wolffii TaxID=409998 RepID=A0A2M9Z7M6_9LEPT|nr:RHS repeat-associated core domain-containing protein [Leptospira wolffii]PJZ64430.1 hypothetical protein CH371_18635 [Leptospira wolffii]